jgi:hypothetical protein
VLVGGAVSETLKFAVAFGPVAVWAHDSEVQVNFLKSQEVDVIILYYVVYEQAFFVGFVYVESINILESDAEAGCIM